MKQTLYKKASNGSIVEWSIDVIDNEIHVWYGKVDGRKQHSVKVIKKGKNIGKSNETTPKSQAWLQAQSMYQKKIDSGYEFSIDEAKTSNMIKPMLATTYKERNVHYPALVQPKLDGVRCLAMPDGRLLSRGGKVYKLPHITNALKGMFPGNVVVDGELFTRGLTFQQITSLVKKNRPESISIQYWVYDVVMLDDMKATFNDRFNFLKTIHFNKHVIFTPTYDVSTEKEMLKFHIDFVKDGYEGLIIRNVNGVYRIGARSNDLIKYKKFDDDEFTVIGIESVIQNDVEAPLFHCVTKDGLEFKAFQSGTMRDKQKMLSNKDSFIGKQLKVKFFGYTDRGVPRFPIGLGIRLKEDM